MQHILIEFSEEENGPVANPHAGSVWRDDQGLLWEIADSRFAWSGSTPIDFSGSDWVADGGVVPLPIGSLEEGQPDRRLYAAMGPGSTTTFKSYSYLMLVVDLTEDDPETEAIDPPVIRIVRTRGPRLVDPDIANQPHP